MSEVVVEGAGENAGGGAGENAGENEVPVVDERDARITALEAELKVRADAQAVLETQLKGAKSEEEFASVAADYSAQIAELNLQLAHSAVMREFGLPDDVADLVFGADEGEMKSRAAKLKAFRGVSVTGSTNRSGGGAAGAGAGAGASLPDDPAALARLIPRNGLVV